MSVGVLKKQKRAMPLTVGADSNGMIMTPQEFDRADFDDGWRYELINGVLIVSPIPLESEADPNEELGHWLRTYQAQHPQGSSLDKTLSERTVRTGRNRRRPDRSIWAGLGRLPKRDEKPTIVVEFVSRRSRDRERDYAAKRDEYMRIKIKEYWLIDRFDRCLVVFSRHGDKVRSQVIREKEVYTTLLLPGFELPLAKLLVLADSWARREKGAD